MEIRRCWGTKEELSREYHDKQWGVPTYDDRVLFEFIILEGAQAGLSWITILKRRENYRKALDGFDYNKIAKYTEKDVERLLNDEGIIRNKLKINSTIINAKAFLEIKKEFGTFADYLWEFVDHKPINNGFKTWKDVPAKTELSDKISKDLKKRGMKFVGSTIIYAYMQAVGIVNDHLISCFRYEEIASIKEK